jgi:hypothetical protein
MPRDHRSYDYGLRGDPYASRPARRAAPPGYDAGFERRADPAGRSANRVTAPYTYDYVFGGRGDRYPRNFNAYTGNHPGRMRDPHAADRPYTTGSGTRTSRGMPRIDWYDRPYFGPDYGGRYPDEV